MGDSHTLCWLRRSGEQTEVSFGILSSGRLYQSRLLLCAVKTRNLSKGFGVFLLTEAFRGDRQCSHPCPVTWEKQPSFHGAERLETPRSLPQQVYVHCRFQNTTIRARFSTSPCSRLSGAGVQPIEVPQPPLAHPKPARIVHEDDPLLHNLWRTIVTAAETAVATAPVET